MTAATVSRWARRYVLASAAFLLLWQVGVVAGVPRRTEVTLALFGFVLHMIFGKAYSLVPSYFDRELAFPRAPAVGFPLAVAGTAGLAAASLGGGPAWLAPLGATLWGLGVAVFVGTLAWTVRDNLTGGATGTGEANADRRPTDRLANAFVPVAGLYLVAGTYGTLALHTGLPLLIDGYAPRLTHLLAAGTAALLIFALGFRLLPRFLVASVPRPLVAVVLVAGAVAPWLLAVRLGIGVWFRVGALLEALAVIGFAAGCWLLFARSDRRRVGFYGVLAGTASGVVGVALGLAFAFGHGSADLVVAHRRLNLLGFVGFTIVGLAYQFYPPAVGALPGSSDRTALISIATLVLGLLGQVVGLAAARPLVTTVGAVVALAGALLYAYLLGSVFRAR
jgi:hypothetical protein